jgi:hypothetical protein
MLRARRNYDYLATRYGADVARNAATGPVPVMNSFFFWQDSSSNRSVAAVENDGSLSYFIREIPNSPSIAALPADQARPFAERALQDFFHQDPKSLDLVTAGVVVSGDLGAAPSFLSGSQRLPGLGMEFEWVDRHYRFDMTRRYVVRLLGHDVQSMELTYLPPPSFNWRKPPNWQVPVTMGIAILAVGFGILRMRKGVPLGARWRVATCAMMFILGLWTPFPFDSLSRVATGVLLGLACATLWFFLSVALEDCLRSMPEKTWTAFSLVRPMFLSNTFALAIGRGTLVGLSLLGIETAIIRLTQLHLHGYLDGYFHIILPPQYLAWWPYGDRLFDALFQTLSIGCLMGLMLGVCFRLIRSRPAAVLAAAAAMALTGIHWSMGTVEPAWVQVSVLFLDYLVLAFAFAAYDLLTMLVAFFTFAFLWGEYYNILASLERTGEYFLIALWIVAVIVGIGLASRSRVRQQYKKFSAAVG